MFRKLYLFRENFQKKCLTISLEKFNQRKPTDFFLWIDDELLPKSYGDYTKSSQLSFKPFKLSGESDSIKLLRNESLGFEYQEKGITKHSLFERYVFYDLFMHCCLWEGNLKMGWMCQVFSSKSKVFSNQSFM